MTAESDRLKRDGAAWRRWGPYLSERAWGTVREDYSPTGEAWAYFPHEHARSRVYRWNEDGLAGICDDQQRLCFALALWNGRDPILKERLFGLSGPEGNHGEDVKEYYFYLDSTPTHSYMRMLYKYPQTAFPYRELVEENARRGRQALEYELLDTGVFDGDRYFDVFVEYAKAGSHDILIRISAVNRGLEPATLHLLPTLWFRNTWTWGRGDGRPELSMSGVLARRGVFSQVIQAQHDTLGKYELYCEEAGELLFTNNETNFERLYGVTNGTPYVKDAFHDYVVHGNRCAVNADQVGTKAAALYRRTVAAGATTVIRLRLASVSTPGQPNHAPFVDFDRIFDQRRRETDEFYSELQSWASDSAAYDDNERISSDLCRIQRQAYAGLLWSKQFYHYDVDMWLAGDPAQPTPPAERLRGRNHEWRHFNSQDVLSMPDKWEYPWFATWDLAFQAVALARVDAEFAKQQLILLGREWYQHPNGQIPAYEWAFGDVNPPVLAWAAYRVFTIDRQRNGSADIAFLERVFHKLMLSFTWWVNRKDAEGNNIFQGGFLGLDNIGVFDRSAPLPTGGHIEQSDGTSWMGMFCLSMMRIALELAQRNPVYEDVATKFFEHFMYIAGAMNNMGGEGISLWDEKDKFFYDVLHFPDNTTLPLRIRSVVGLIPLFGVEIIDADLLERVPDFKKRMEWFLANRPVLAQQTSAWDGPGKGKRHMVALVRGDRMVNLLKRALDPAEFLSDYGIRALSKYHEAEPYVIATGGMSHEVCYEPAESRTGLFGGNSNWRGPVWFPLNYLLIEALQKCHEYENDDFRVECPTRSGRFMTLHEVADELSLRQINLFLRNDQGRRPVFGDQALLQTDPNWRDYIPFHEYFNGDTGAGLGASHQTGWTGLVAELIQQLGERLSVWSTCQTGLHLPS